LVSDSELSLLLLASLAAGSGFFAFFLTFLGLGLGSSSLLSSALDSALDSSDEDSVDASEDASEEDSGSRGFFKADLRGLSLNVTLFSSGGLGASGCLGFFLRFLEGRVRG
jgi:hypothetical protein